MDHASASRRLAESMVARLATVGPDGSPHIVPVCFALEGKSIFFAVDRKPKRTSNLKRLRNIATHPEVAVLVDHYDDDWDRLWWVRADGTAHVLGPGAKAQHALALLAARYPQYRTKPPSGPVVEIVIVRLSGWSAT
jgi:PPOX class probable F420-dependent enzyme